MIEVKYDICQEVVFLNTTTWKLEKGVVKGVQIVPTAVSHDSEGKEQLDGYAILYTLDNRMVISESEAFATEEAAREFIKKTVEGI